MSRRKIVLTIDCEDRTCGLCDFVDKDGNTPFCCLFDTELGIYTDSTIQRTRRCRTAEKGAHK